MLSFILGEQSFLYVDIDKYTNIRKAKTKCNINALDGGKKHREFGQRREWGAIMVTGTLHLMDKDNASNVKSLDQEHRDSDSGRTSFS